MFLSTTLNYLAIIFPWHLENGCCSYKKSFLKDDLLLKNGVLKKNNPWQFEGTGIIQLPSLGIKLDANMIDFEGFPPKKLQKWSLGWCHLGWPHKNVFLLLHCCWQNLGEKTPKCAAKNPCLRSFGPIWWSDLYEWTISTLGFSDVKALIL